jgi:deazaflavin-dependent oxidoreductase (nitroreductase family)
LAFRLPALLYRVHLGWLLGHRFLLLTHRGRKSGRRRQTVLEVVRYDPATHESVVASGWRDRADWYRNLLAHPALAVQTGRERYLPTQRFLTPVEASAVLREYERHHPWAALVGEKLLGLPFGSAAGDRAAAAAPPMVAFRPARRVAR